MVKKINKEEFEAVKAEKVALIDFSATWCGPCKMIAPVLEEVSEVLGDKVGFYNVDVDENEEISDAFGIMSIPALVVLKEGKQVGMRVGFQQKDALIKFIEQYL